MSYNYYVNDQRCGPAVTINNKSAYYTFSADLKSLVPVAGAVETNFFKATGGSGWFVNNHDIQPGQIITTFYVGGEEKQDCYMNTSNLITECKNCVIKTDEDEFEYVAVLTSVDVRETGIEYFNEVVLTFSAIRRLGLVEHTLVKTSGHDYASFINVGSIASGMRIEVTPSSNMTSFTVAGITLSNLTAQTTFAIDGIVGEVKNGNLNGFLNTDLIDFPKVQPGENRIEFGTGTVTVKVKYYPTFMI